MSTKNERILILENTLMHLTEEVTYLRQQVEKQGPPKRPEGAPSLLKPYLGQVILVISEGRLTATPSLVYDVFDDETPVRGESGGTPQVRVGNDDDGAEIPYVGPGTAFTDTPFAIDAAFAADCYGPELKGLLKEKEA